MYEPDYECNALYPCCQLDNFLIYMLQLMVNMANQICETWSVKGHPWINLYTEISSPCYLSTWKCKNHWLVMFGAFAEARIIYLFFCWKIHCRGGSWLNRPYKYTQQGRLVIQPPLQKSTTGAADITSHPYRGHYRGGWKHQPPLQRALQGRSGNRPYRGTLCRNTLGRAAGAAAPTDALEPPLQ